MFDKMKLWKSQNSSSNLRERVEKIKELQIPEHVAIIMDGNGRWAKNGRSQELPAIMRNEGRPKNHQICKRYWSEDSNLICILN